VVPHQKNKRLLSKIVKWLGSPSLVEHLKECSLSAWELINWYHKWLLVFNKELPTKVLTQRLSTVL